MSARWMAIALALTVAFAGVVLVPPAEAAVASVAVVDDAFSPSRIEVQVGDTVSWTNRGRDGHTVTSMTAGQFSSGNMAPGANFQKTFDTDRKSVV